MQEGIFKRLLEVVEVAQYNADEQFVYQESLKDYWDLKSSMDTYFMEGKEEGREEQAIKSALIAIKKGLENEFIEEMTGLSEGKINELRNKQTD